MAQYRPCDREHFYSPETAISLELPADVWHMDGGTAGSVAYVRSRPDLDVDGHPDRIDAQLIEIPGNPPDAFRHLAAELARAAGVDPDEGVDATVDGHPALRSVVATTVGGVGPVVQHLTVAQVGHLVLSIVGTAEQRHGDRFGREYADAVDSIRIIPDGAEVGP